MPTRDASCLVLLYQLMEHKDLNPGAPRPASLWEVKKKRVSMDFLIIQGAWLSEQSVTLRLYYPEAMPPVHGTVVG